MQVRDHDRKSYWEIAEGVEAVLKEFPGALERFRQHRRAYAGSTGSEPFNKGPDGQVLLSDKYFWLGVLHDVCLSQIPIAPENVTDEATETSVPVWDARLKLEWLLENDKRSEEELVITFRRFLADVREDLAKQHEHKAEVGGLPPGNAAWQLRPFDPDCRETVPIDQDTIQAVRKVIPDWDGQNWAAVRAVLEEHGVSDSRIAAMTVMDVRMRFTVGQKNIVQALGGQAQTTRGIIQNVASGPPVPITISLGTNYQAWAKGLLEIQAKCRERHSVLVRHGWRDDDENTYARAAQTPEAKAAELAVLGLIKANEAALMFWRNSLAPDPSTALDLAFASIGLCVAGRLEVLKDIPGALPAYLAVEVAQPNVAELYREPTFIVQLGRWAQRLMELAAQTDHAGLTPTPARLAAQSGQEGQSGEPAADADDKIKEPSADAIAAYRLVFVTGMNQTDAAQALAKGWKRPVNQGQVSRWCAEVKLWIKAGNVLPDLDQQSRAPTMRAVDPVKLDCQTRPDGRMRPRKSRLQYDASDGD